MVEAVAIFLAVFLVVFLADFLAGFFTGDFFPVVDFLPAAFLALGAFFLATFFFLTTAVPDVDFLLAFFLRARFLAFAGAFCWSLSLAVLPITASITGVVLIEAAIIPNVEGIFNRQHYGGGHLFRYIEAREGGSRPERDFPGGYRNCDCACCQKSTRTKLHFPMLSVTCFVRQAEKGASCLTFSATPGVTGFYEVSHVPGCSSGCAAYWLCQFTGS